MTSGIPDRVKNFIFTYVDSIELLEVLLIFQKDINRSWTAADLTRDLRSTLPSVSRRISFLEASGLILRDEGTLEIYRYHPANDTLRELVTELASIYEIRRHKIFELIYSPTKKARDFAEAFQITGTRKNGRIDE